MRKNKKRTLVMFFAFFVGFLLFIILTSHFFGLKGGILPLTWQEILDDWHIPVIISFVSALFMTIYAER